MADGQDAHTLYEQEVSRRKIVTLCKNLDEALGGGISPGRVVELCGQPGVGKTQLGIQIALAVQLPWCFGGIQGRALFIDTEGSLTSERVADMAAALLVHLQHTAASSGSTIRIEEVRCLSVEGLLDGITVLRAVTAVEVCAAVEMLDQYLVEDASLGTTPTKLIVIDSISARLSHDLGDFGRRARVLSAASDQLLALTIKYPSVAVVLTNQLTTKLKDGLTPTLTPALGEAWLQTAHDRVELRWSGQHRLAQVTKPTYSRSSMLELVITLGGPRGRSAAKRKSVM